MLNGKPWSIGIENPFDRESNLEIIYLSFGGVATSGKDVHRWLRNGVIHHHIIDPRTCLPAETDVLTATVIAPTTYGSRGNGEICFDFPQSSWHGTIER